MDNLNEKPRKKMSRQAADDIKKMMVTLPQRRKEFENALAGDQDPVQFVTNLFDALTRLVQVGQTFNLEPEMGFAVQTSMIMIQRAIEDTWGVKDFEEMLDQRVEQDEGGGLKIVQPE